MSSEKWTERGIDTAADDDAQLMILDLSAVAALQNRRIALFDLRRTGLLVFDQSKSYLIGSRVIHENSIWEAIANTAVSTPFDYTQWKLIVDVAIEFNAMRQYKTNDTVIENDVLWKAQNPPQAVGSFDSSKWDPLVSKLPSDTTPGTVLLTDLLKVEQSSETLIQTTAGDIARTGTTLLVHNASTAYKENDVIIRNGIILRANSTITTGAFTASQWNTIAPIPISTTTLEQPTVVQASSTTVDIGAGVGLVVDNFTNPSTPLFIIVRFAAQAGVTITNLATAPRTILLIDRSGTLSQVTAPPNGVQLRDKFQIGTVSHPDGTIAASGAVMGEPRIMAHNPSVGVEELILALTNNAGALNQGITYIGNVGDTTKFDQSAGKYFGFNRNFETNAQDPNFRDVAAESPVDLQQVFVTTNGPFFKVEPKGTTGFVIPQGVYDDGTAVIANTQPVGSIPVNSWTFHPVFFATFIEEPIFFYGQTLFTSRTDASAAFLAGTGFTAPISTAGGILIGAWVVRGSNAALDLTSLVDAEFVLAPGIAGGGAAITVVDGFGSVSAVDASSVNNATQLNTRVLALEAQFHTEEIAVSDEVTALEVNDFSELRASRGFTATDVRASLTVPQSAGGDIITIDVQKDGVSILDTLITIDDTETTSVTATTPFAFKTLPSDILDFGDDAKIKFILTKQGTAVDARGLKCKIIGATTAP